MTVYLYTPNCKYTPCVIIDCTGITNRDIDFNWPRPEQSRLSNLSLSHVVGGVTH